MIENRNEIQEIWPGWKIESEIGSGGFGKVYKARKELLGQKETYSAIKVIRIPNDPAELSDMQASRMDEKSIREYYKASVEQLTNEIELMERMKSASHVVAIEDYDVVEESETIGWTIYIRMELLTNLNTFIQEKGMSTQDVIKMGIDVLTGLEFCHQEKLIHRDIKPANIFVSDFGEYKIGDFGISREIESTSVTLSQKGTKNYMAPEIVRMEPYGHLVDIYALGLTLYEILNNGRMPFLPPYPEQYSPMDRERAIVKRLSGKEELPEIRGIGRLNDIIRKACAHEPKDRYQSAAEMRDDLQAFSEKFYGESDGKTGVIGSEDLKELQEMLRKLEEEKKKDVPEKNPGSEPQPESEPQPGPEPKPSTEEENQDFENNKEYSYAEGSVSVSDSVKERVVLGTLGAFVGALIGTICIAILGQFGYIDSIGGVVMGFCAMGGYQLLGKKMSKKGIIITIVIMLVMVYVSNWISYAIVWADVWEEDFMTAFWSIQRRVRIGLIKGYYKNLVMLYVFMASGAVPTIKKYFK